MKYYTFNQDGRYTGSAGIEPNDNNWTLTPYQGGLIKEKCIDDAWVEGATQEEIDEANKPTVPTEVQLWRIRTVLKLSNLEATIETALDELDEPTKTAAKNVWNYGTTIDRYSQTVLFIQAVLEMTDAQVDEIFIQAEAIAI